MPLQTHIRSPLFSAAPIPRLRRARAQEGGTILFFGSFNPSDHRTPASSGPIPLKFFNIAAGVGVPLSDGLSGRSERWLAGFARLIARQACNALRHEPRLPPPYHRLGFAGSPHDLGRATAVGGGKDDFGAPNMLLRRVAVS